MKKTIGCLLTLLMILLSACAFAQDAPRYEGVGFATPEEAVQAYLDGMRDADLSQMIGAFAVETYVDHYDFQAQLERLRAYMINLEMHFPNDNDLMRALNVESRKNQIVNGITYQQFALLAPEWDISAPLTFGTDDTEGIPELMAQFAAAAEFDMSGLTFVGFFAPETLAELYLSERNQENMAKQATVCGMDELRSMVAGFSLGGEQYLLCCDVGRYGDAWYMNSLSGNIGNLLGIAVYRGGLVPMSMMF